ncbi:MAG: hypothetical protein U9R27_11455 [Campylobacterota bacterium]|nr:hypothetical protein [Campylobacterota bacterium]
MLKEVLFLGVAVFFAGCNLKHEESLEKSFEQMTPLGKHMQKTEKITLTKDSEVKILLTASYLNGEASIVDDEDRVHEKFIIGVYQADDVDIAGLINADQSLTINVGYPKSDKRFTKAQRDIRKRGVDKPPVTVKKLSPGDPLLKNMPMVNNWSSYYYVEFPHTKKKKFELTYQNRIYGKEPKRSEEADQTYTKYKLNFTKRAKYLYQNNKKLF